MARVLTFFATFVAVVLSLLLVSGGGRGVAAQEGDLPEFLFVQTATGATLNGTLVLTGVSPDTTYFADRPDRITGSMLTEDFMALMTLDTTDEEDFVDDPPNGALVCRVDGVTTTTTITLSFPTLSTDEDGLATLVYDTSVLSARRGGHFFFGSSANTTTGNEEMSAEMLMCDDGAVVSLFIDGSKGALIGKAVGLGAVAVLCPECSPYIVAGVGAGGAATGSAQEDQNEEYDADVDPIQYPPPPPPFGYGKCYVGLIEDPYILPPGAIAGYGVPTCWKPDAAPDCPLDWEAKTGSGVPNCVPDSGEAYTTCPENTVQDPHVTPVGFSAGTPLCIAQPPSCPSGWKDGEFPPGKVFCIPT